MNGPGRSTPPGPATYSSTRQSWSLATTSYSSLPEPGSSVVVVFLVVRVVVEEEGGGVEVVLERAFVLLAARAHQAGLLEQRLAHDVVLVHDLFNDAPAGHERVLDGK